jgi:hypothetical protein
METGACIYESEVDLADIRHYVRLTGVGFGGEAVTPVTP